MRKFFAAIVLLVFATVSALGQTVPLGPRFVLPYQTVIDGTGVPLPGAQLNFYVSGTNTRLNTYSDPLLTTPNPNPVIANAAGVFPNIFLSGNYKVVLTDSSLNQIWTADPVDSNGGSGSLFLGTPGHLPIYNNLGNALIDSTIPVAPVGGLPLYAAPAAIGTGNCLSAGNACTLATACSFAKQIATFLGPGGPINLADGAYNTVDANSALCSVLGNGGGSAPQLLSVVGNCGSPTNVILAVPANSIGIYIKDGGEAAVSCFEVTLGAGASGIQNAGQGGVADYGKIVWGTSGANSVHVSGGPGSYINLSNAGETIATNFNLHWLFSGDAQFSAAGVTAISNSTTFTGFLTASGGGYYLNLLSWSFTGSALTGVRATLIGPGHMVTAAAASCASVLPGTGGGNCSFSFGAQDNAGDGITGTGPVVGKEGPTIDNPIVEAQLYSSLPVSPTAGQISHIIDGATGIVVTVFAQRLGQLSRVALALLELIFLLAGIQQTPSGGFSERRPYPE